MQLATFPPTVERDPREQHGFGQPEIEIPRTAADLASHYDLVLSHSDDPDFSTNFGFFHECLARAAEEQGLRVALLHPGIVEEALSRLGRGQLRITYHLDFASRWQQSADPFARLAEAVQDTGGWTINAVTRSRLFRDKAAAHNELVRAGLGTPATILFRPWMPERPLTAAEREQLHLDEPEAECHLIPATAASPPVRVSMNQTRDFVLALARLRRLHPDDTILIQQAIEPPLLVCADGVRRPARWRILACLGEWLPFWWTPPGQLAPGQLCYQTLCPTDLRQQRLQPVLTYAQRLAELSGLEWFVTELCLHDGPEMSIDTVPGPQGQERSVLAIDSVKEQGIVGEQNRRAGIPDQAIRWIAGRIVQAAWQRRQAILRPNVRYYRIVA
jgi:hypothetical protein